MKKASLLMTLFMIAGILLSGCIDEEKKESVDPEKIRVYTTVYPLQYFTDIIGGEYVDVETIYPPGADEHTFEPSQKDMMNLADADLFIFIGLGLEGFVDKAKGTLKNQEVSMLAAGENIQFEDHSDDLDEKHQDEEADNEGKDVAENSHHEHDHADVDPHVWLDPHYAKGLAEAIKKELVGELPSHKETFEKNYQEIVNELERLDSQFKKTIESATHKEIIVAHSAYGYWEERYGIKQISISGKSTTAEPSQKELQNLIAHGKQVGLKYVLTEQNFNSRLAETVQKAIGAKLLTLHNLSVLTDNDIENHETYFSLMEKNLDTLNLALND